MTQAGLFCKAAGESAQDLDKATGSTVRELFENRN
jgi:hypothetical protein